MIPSRTVFNHCKWIYIELAITGAHSGMGPLCISPAPTPAARARANVFPISSLRTTNCSNPSTPGIVSRSQPSPLFIFSISFSLFLPLLLSLRHYILLPLTVTSHSKYSFFFYASLFLFSPHYLKVLVCLPFSFSFPVTLKVFFPISFLLVSLGFLSLSFLRSCLVHPYSFAYILLFLSFDFSLFLLSSSSTSTSGFSWFLQNKPLVVSVLVSVLHSRKTGGRLVSLDSGVSYRGMEGNLR